MRIGIIQASSQVTKNEVLFEYTKNYAVGHKAINFGCFADEVIDYSYVEIAVAIGLLLNSGAVDFVVTGCSSGQGMMLVCNTMPNVICGYAPTPMDAYLFVQINNGNAISLPLGEDYTYSDEENCRNTVKKLFSEPFGQGYPKEEACRKIKDTELFKDMKTKTHIEFIPFLDKLDTKLRNKILSKTNVIQYILENGSNEDVIDWIKQHTNSSL